MKKKRHGGIFATIKLKANDIDGRTIDEEVVRVGDSDRIDGFAERIKRKYA